MDLNASEALARVREWEQRSTRISGMLLSDTSMMEVAFAGRVTITNNVITVKEDSFEFRLLLIQQMIFKYAEAVLEIRALGWRCVLYEPKE